MDSVTIPAPQIDTNPKITTGDGITNATVVDMDTWIWATDTDKLSVLLKRSISK